MMPKQFKRGSCSLAVEVRRRASRNLGLLVIAGLAIATPSAARAEPTAAGKRVLVVPLTGDGVDASELTATLVEAARAAGATPSMAKVTREDLATLTGCRDDTPACIGKASELVGVDIIVLGTATAAGDDDLLRVRLTWIEASAAARSESFAIEVERSGAPAEAFAPYARAFFAGEPLPAQSRGPEPAPEPPPATELVAAPARSPTARFDLRAVEPSSWSIAGGGAALLAAGSVLLVASRGKQDEVDAAPTATVADLEALRDLEDNGKRLTLWGNVALATGGAATAVGAVLIVRDARAGTSARHRLALVPLAVPGGGGLALTWGAR
jgi:hypothetical protein